MVIGRDGSALTDSEAILEKLVDGTAALAPLGGIGEELAGYKGIWLCHRRGNIVPPPLQAGNSLKMLTGVQDGKKVPYHLGPFLYCD